MFSDEVAEQRLRNTLKTEWLVDNKIKTAALVLLYLKNCSTLQNSRDARAEDHPFKR